MRALFALIGFAALAWSVAAVPARAEDIYNLTIKDHKFTPDTIEIPANTKVQFLVKNADATSEEFDSHALHREKVIPGGGQAVINIGPLKPGSYKFIGEYHEDTAKGVVIAK